jgi:HlyD family secretion protein
MKRFFKRPIGIIVLLILLGAGIGALKFFGGSQEPTYETMIVARYTLVQEVSVTGRVKSAESVDLAFESSGRVARVLTQIGDRVESGEVLVYLDDTELLANLAGAQADVKAQETKLQELRRGTRVEELQVQRVKVENARLAADDAKQSLFNALQDSYTKTDDAVRNKADQAFLNPRGSSPQLRFGVADPQLEMNIEAERMALEGKLSVWEASLKTFLVGDDFTSVLSATQQNLILAKNFLGNLAFAINGAVSDPTISSATLTTWKTDISTARTNINTAITNVSAAQEKLQTAESGLALERQNLALQEAGSSAEEIITQEAQLAQAQAAEGKIHAQLAKTRLRSPIQGIVTKQDAKAGELVSAAVPIVSLISDNDFEIEANVPEADIAKIAVGNTAQVTLDAYGRDVVFEARVVSVDPAEIIIEGVATYKATLQFLQEDERVKSGMTSNINITSDRRENVLAISQRSLVRKNGDKLVRVLQGKEISEVFVETGLRGSDGNIEILSGLQEGDVVVISKQGE